MRKGLLLFLFSLPLLAAKTPSNEIWFHGLGDRRGEIEPCGCPRVQLGGLHRLVAYYEEERRENPHRSTLVLDTGNTFFSLPALPDSRVDLEQNKASLIADGYRLLGVKALVPGPRDLALGRTRLDALAKQAGLRLVASNVVDSDGKDLFEPFLVLPTDGGTRVGIAGIVDPDAVMTPGKVLNTKEAALKALGGMKSQGAQVTVLVAQDRVTGENLKSSFDVVLTPPEREGKGFTLLAWNRDGKNITFSKNVDLDPSWDKKNAFQKKYERYLAKIHKDAVNKVSSKAAPTKGFVAHAGQCRSCHQKQYDFWAQTKHASAYLVLFSKNQHFNPECIVCHSLGFQDKRGFSDITAPIHLVGEAARKKGETPFVELMMQDIFKDDTGTGPLDSRKAPERFETLQKKYYGKIESLEKEGKIQSLHMGVQCEHCHGIRDGHPGPEFKKVGKVKEARCLECHIPPHDEAFSFKKMVSRVACPLR